MARATDKPRGRTTTRTSRTGDAYEQRTKARGNGEGSIFKRTIKRKRADGTIEEVILWTAAYKLTNGKRATVSGRTYDDASRKLKGARQDQERGVLPAGRKLTVAAYLAQWLKDSASQRVRPSTLVSYELHVNKHLSPGLGHHQLATLTPQHVQAFLNEKAASGLAPRTVQYMRAVLRSALNRAVKWQLVVRNVATMVDPPRMTATAPEPLAPDQAQALLREAAGHRLEHLYAVLLGTGLRLGEALALRWQDVDLDDGVLRVQHTLERLRGRPWRLAETKSASGARTVPLIGPTAAALRAQRTRGKEMRLAAGELWQEMGFVFPSTLGTPLDGTNVYHEYKKLLSATVRRQYRAEGAPYGDTAAGLTRWAAERPADQAMLAHRVHDLRHSTATYLMAAGVPVRVVMEIMGWSQISMAMRYQHALPEVLIDARSRLEAVFPVAVGAR